MAPFSKKLRRCRSFDGSSYFKPRGIPIAELEINELELDELEAMHLCDYEDLQQIEAAKKMQISSSTLQRLLYAGRRKIIDALYSSKAIKISKPERVLEYLELKGRCCRQNHAECKCHKRGGKQ